MQEKSFQRLQKELDKVIFVEYYIFNDNKKEVNKKKILYSARVYDKGGFHYQGKHMVENTRNRATAIAVNLSIMFILDNLPEMDEEAYGVIESAILAAAEGLEGYEEIEGKMVPGRRLGCREDIRRYLGL